MARGKQLDIDPALVVARLPSAYAHIGLYDVKRRKAWAARDSAARPAISLEHADLLLNATPPSPHAPAAAAAHSVRGANKDRFVCFWFYPPHAREGLVQGYPVDWSEFNLLVRLDPRWSYLRQTLLPALHTAAIEANLSQQIGYAAHILQLYRAGGLQAALNVHMIGPRATDSLFYAHRWEPPY